MKTVLAVLLCSIAAAAQTPVADPAATLARELPKWLAAAEVPGAAVALVGPGAPVKVLNFGQTGSSPDHAVDDDTVFSAGSLSKPVFAYAVLRLVDQGKLDLDAPLTKYVSKPFLANDPRLSQITARLVLTHRSGLPNRPARDGSLRLYFAPGERFSYSGEGYRYLQQAVEAITDEPLDAVMKREVFAPLGMAHSSFVTQARWTSAMAGGHNADGSPAPVPHSHVAMAADSLITTAADYARFLQAILNGTGLKPATLAQMETPAVAVDPSCVTCGGPAARELSSELFWGLGFGIEKTASGTYLWHWGDNNIFKSFAAADPARHTAVVLLTNSDNGLTIAPAVLRAVFGGVHPALAWLHVRAYDDPNFRFDLYSYKHGAAETLAAFSKEAAAGSVSEDTINSYGYRLLRQKDNAAAIKVFVLNTHLHPESANVYDSLGQAYMIDGQVQPAIDNYSKELELNPRSGDARQALELLQKNRPVIQQPTPLIHP